MDNVHSLATESKRHLSVGMYGIYEMKTIFIFCGMAVLAVNGWCMDVVEKLPIPGISEDYLAKLGNKKEGFLIAQLLDESRHERHSAIMYRLAANSTSKPALSALKSFASKGCDTSIHAKDKLGLLHQALATIGDIGGVDGTRYLETWLSKTMLKRKLKGCVYSGQSEKDIEEFVLKGIIRGLSMNESDEAKALLASIREGKVSVIMPAGFKDYFDTGE